MALTQGAKIGLIAVIIGCTGYGIMKYRSNVTSALKSASGDTTSAQTKQDTVVSEIQEPTDNKKEVVKDNNVVVPVEKHESTQKSTKNKTKPKKHESVKKEHKEPTSQESSKSNNVIPNF